MKKISLTQGKIALVDNDDFDYLNQWMWYAVNPNYKKDLWYARRANPIKGKKAIIMHRVIMKEENSKVFIDHKDHNGLNNQKRNLRKCTHSENQRNRIGHGTSKYLGVSFSKGEKRYKVKSGEERIWVNTKWRAFIYVNNRLIALGVFIKETDAAMAYNKAAKKHFGKFANFNKIK